jgi:integrase
MLSAAKEFAGNKEKGHVIEYHGKPVASIKKGFREVCVTAGIKGVSPHILRHTAATGWPSTA